MLVVGKDRQPIGPGKRQARENLHDQAVNLREVREFFFELQADLLQEGMGDGAVMSAAEQFSHRPNQQQLMKNLLLAGDLVQAVVPSGKKAGTHVGRVAVRSSGSFNSTTTGAHI